MQISQIYITDGDQELTQFLKDRVSSVKKYYCTEGNEYVLYTDSTLKQFIADNFSEEVVWAYDCLLPYAYKADLGKYCILYKLGGWYLDITCDAANFPNIDEETKCVLFRDIQTEHYIFSNCSIANNIMYSEAGNQLFLDAINQIVQHCRDNYYGLTPVCVSGPNMLGKIVAKYTPCRWIHFGVYTQLTPDAKQKNAANIMADGLVLAISKGTISLSGYGKNTNNYARMWKDGVVYKDLAPYTMLKNLYRFILQREPDNQGIKSYNQKDFNEVKHILLTSSEHQSLNQQVTVRKRHNLPYAIISVNNRAHDNIDRTKSLLKDLDFKTLEYFNAETNDIDQFYNVRQIDFNWNKKLFNRDALTGEYGITASQILTYEYILDNDIDEMLVFEDDAVIDEAFLDKFYACYADLPESWDYLADCSDFPHHTICEKVHENILIGSRVICKAHLLNAHLGVMLYSKQGAKKILNALKFYGFTSPIDTFIYDLTRSGYLNGYSTYTKNRLLINKDQYGTLIDGNNIRK